MMLLASVYSSIFAVLEIRTYVPNKRNFNQTFMQLVQTATSRLIFKN